MDRYMRVKCLYLIFSCFIAFLLSYCFMPDMAKSTCDCDKCNSSTCKKDLDCINSCVGCDDECSVQQQQVQQNNSEQERATSTVSELDKFNQNLTKNMDKKEIPSNQALVSNEAFYHVGASEMDVFSEEFHYSKESGSPCYRYYFTKDAFFPFDSTVIRPAAKAWLAWFSSLLDAADFSIQVEGHTCSIGAAEYNLTLSSKRAYTVKGFLMENNISWQRLRTAAYGEYKPRYSNETEYGRSMNRRVELVVCERIQCPTGQVFEIINGLTYCCTNDDYCARYEKGDKIGQYQKGSKLRGTQ